MKKQGISLMVLVLTIIIMVILAGTVIISLNNAGVINRSQNAISEYNLKQVEEIANVAWGQAFVAGNRTQSDLEAYVYKEVQENGINLNTYDIQVTTSGVIISIKKQIPEDWKENVIAVTSDGVPIPKGFVASKASSEDEKIEGLVIYEGTEPVTDENVEISRRTRNQFVWVPVEHFNDFKRDTFGQSGIVIAETTATNDYEYREIDTDPKTNMPIKATSIINLQEATAMYESVKEYGGFYIARYEAGSSNDNDQYINYGNVSYVMGNYPMRGYPNSNTEKIYSTKDDYGVISTWIYGVQWDAVLKWFEKTGCDFKSNAFVTNHGNHLGNGIIVRATLNEGAKLWQYMDEEGNLLEDVPFYTYKTKESVKFPLEGDWLMTTGACELSNINNIYDMIGNLAENTLEYVGNYWSSTRGGSFYNFASIYKRIYQFDPLGPYDAAGSRETLYIKK